LTPKQIDFLFHVKKTSYKKNLKKLYATTSNLNRVTGMIFTISKCFHRSKPKFYNLYLHNKAAKKYQRI